MGSGNAFACAGRARDATTASCSASTSGFCARASATRPSSVAGSAPPADRGLAATVIPPRTERSTTTRMDFTIPPRLRTDPRPKGVRPGASRTVSGRRTPSRARADLARAGRDQMRRMVGGGDGASGTAGRPRAWSPGDAATGRVATGRGAASAEAAGERSASARSGASSQQPSSAALTPTGGAQHACSSACFDAERSGAQPHGAGSAATRATTASTAASVRRVRPIAFMEARRRGGVKPRASPASPAGARTRPPREPVPASAGRATSARSARVPGRPSPAPAPAPRSRGAEGRGWRHP